MILGITDTETTGLTDTDQVVELAVLLRHDDKRRTSSTTLIKPTVAMHPAARATHHITDAELESAPSMAQALKSKPWDKVSSVILVAHNAAFDVRMLKQSGVGDKQMPSRVICTYRCARHIWPDAPSHGNQALRYYLDLQDCPSIKEFPPHRALSDVLVTAALLEAMLERHTPEALLAMTSGPVLLRFIRVGRYKGKSWSEVPKDYLRWVLSAKEPFDEDVRYTAKFYLENGVKR